MLEELKELYRKIGDGADHLDPTFDQISKLKDSEPDYSGILCL